jgi:hypothetical protein
VLVLCVVVAKSTVHTRPSDEKDLSFGAKELDGNPAAQAGATGPRDWHAARYRRLLEGSEGQGNTLGLVAVEIDVHDGVAPLG